MVINRNTRYNSSGKIAQIFSLNDIFNTDFIFIYFKTLNFFAKNFFTSWLDTKI